MDTIDATNREANADEAITPSSLLTIILDTNPLAWDTLSPHLPLSTALSSLLLFINAHLAMNGSNQIAILASHTDRVAWLYPTPTSKSSKAHHEVTEENANKYRPFLTIETEILANLRRLMESTSEESLRDETQIAGSLTMALSFINQASLQASPGKDTFNQTSESTLQTTQSGATQSTATSLLSRILILSVSSDLSAQYISVMNAIFASQRLGIPIDVLKLAGSTTFLQQAADATEGVFLAPEVGSMRREGLLQYLMMGYLPDGVARAFLNRPGKTEVDFRAACFCHRRVVDVGFVCSICLSIFCDPNVLQDDMCLTCGTVLGMPGGWNVVPALIQKKKKKKKVTDGVGTPASRADTPV